MGHQHIRNRTVTSHVRMSRYRPSHIDSSFIFSENTLSMPWLFSKCKESKADW